MSRDGHDLAIARVTCERAETEAEEAARAAEDRWHDALALRSSVETALRLYHMRRTCACPRG